MSNGNARSPDDRREWASRSSVGRRPRPVGAPRKPYLLPTGLPYNVTATLSFSGNDAPAWRFSKRWLQDDIKIGNTSHTLAADWTAPNAFYWKMCDLDDLKIQNVILPGRFSEETGLYFLQPYDPDKIPLVFVHGLVSSPDAFKNMINDLAPHPWFRENYQVWLFNYPTGNAVDLQQHEVPQVHEPTPAPTPVPRAAAET